MKPYLSLAELAEQIPFTAQAIRMLMHRKELREGTHYFRHGRRLVFKWEAIAEWIEQPHPNPSGDVIELIRAGGLR